MNISSTRTAIDNRSRRIAPERQLAKEAYTEARDSFTPVSETHSKNVRRANKVSASIVLLGSVSAWVGTAVALVAAGSPPLASGFPAAGAGFMAYTALDYVSEKASDLYLDKTSAPAFAQGASSVREARDNYYEALMTEMDDEGVRKVHQESWDFQTEIEQSMLPSGGYAVSNINNIMKDVEFLADERLTEGWSGDLARLDDNTYIYRQHKRFISEHKNPEKLVQIYENGLEQGKSGSEAFKAVREAAEPIGG